MIFNKLMDELSDNHNRERFIDVLIDGFEKYEKKKNKRIYEAIANYPRIRIDEINDDVANTIENEMFRATLVHVPTRDANIHAALTDEQIQMLASFGNYIRNCTYQMGRGGMIGDVIDEDLQNWWMTYER